MDVKIFDEFETVLKIYNDKCSICRFGDGEIYHLFRTDPKCKSGGQTCSINFKNNLEKVLNNNDEKILIGFSGYFSNNDFKQKNYKLNLLSKSTLKFINKFSIKLNDKYKKIFEEKKYSAEITRLHQLIDPYPIIDIFNKMFIENDCFFIGNEKIINLLKNNNKIKFKSIEFFKAPNSNAYDNYNNLLEEIIKTDSIKNKLLLVSLGPTATVMCYDLAKMGFWAIDIGHYFEIYHDIF